MQLSAPKRYICCWGRSEIGRCLPLRRGWTQTPRTGPAVPKERERGWKPCLAVKEDTPVSLSEAGESTSRPELRGEDAAYFDSSQQSTVKWTIFTVELAAVLAILYQVCSLPCMDHCSLYFANTVSDWQVWIAPQGGLAGPFAAGIESLLSSSEVVMVAIFAVFALVHSGLAFLRPYGTALYEIKPFMTLQFERIPSYTCAGEQLVGARAFRVLFASLSLPLALLAVVYFINHRYDGAQLWNLRGQPFVHETVWLLNFISFYFLYPSTFNLLEV